MAVGVLLVEQPHVGVVPDEQPVDELAIPYGVEGQVDLVDVSGEVLRGAQLLGRRRFRVLRLGALGLCLRRRGSVGEAGDGTRFQPGSNSGSPPPGGDHGTNPGCLPFVPAASGGSHVALLQHVGELVGQDAPAPGRGGLVLAGTEGDVRPARVGDGPHRARRSGGGFVVVDPDLAQVRCEAALHLGPDVGLQRTALRMDSGWRPRPRPGVRGDDVPEARYGTARLLTGSSSASG